MIKLKYCYEWFDMTVLMSKNNFQITKRNDLALYQSIVPHLDIIHCRGSACPLTIPFNIGPKWGQLHLQWAEAQIIKAQRMYVVVVAEYRKGSFLAVNNWYVFSHFWEGHIST